MSSTPINFGANYPRIIQDLNLATYNIQPLTNGAYLKVAGSTIVPASSTSGAANQLEDASSNIYNIQTLSNGQVLEVSGTNIIGVYPQVTMQEVLTPATSMVSSNTATDSMIQGTSYTPGVIPIFNVVDSTSVSTQAGFMKVIQLRNDETQPVIIKTSKGSFVMGDSYDQLFSYSRRISLVSDPIGSAYYWRMSERNLVTMFPSSLVTSVTSATASPTKVSVAISSNQGAYQPSLEYTGAWGVVDNTNNGTVSMYSVYGPSGSPLSLLTTINSPVAIGSGASFGYSVAISSNGTTLVVGAPLFNSQRGGAAVYTRDPVTPTVFTYLQTLTLPGAANNDQAGYSVAISGDGKRIAVGALNYNLGHGGVGVFALNAGVYTIENGGVVLTSSKVSYTNIGKSVALDFNGLNLVAGVTLSPNGGVFKWTRSGTNWNLSVANTNPLVIPAGVLSGSSTLTIGNSVCIDSFGSNIMSSNSSGYSGPSDNNGAVAHFYNTTFVKMITSSYPADTNFGASCCCTTTGTGLVVTRTCLTGSPANTKGGMEYFLNGSNSFVWSSMFNGIPSAAVSDFGEASCITGDGDVVLVSTKSSPPILYISS